MKHLVPHRPRRVLIILLIVFLALFGLMPTYAIANLTEYETSNLADDKLLVNAYSAYGKDDWLQAALLFSAYLDRNPELLQSDSQRRENTDALYDYAISRLKNGLEAAKSLHSVPNILVGSTGQYVVPQTPSMPPLPPTPIPLADAGYFRIHFKNNCSSTIWTAVHYRNLSYQWVTNGWWELAPGETAFVAKTTNTIYYLHAASSDLTWSGDAYYDNIKGSDEVYGFIEKQITAQEWGDWTASFSCD